MITEHREQVPDERLDELLRHDYWAENQMAVTGPICTALRDYKSLRAMLAKAVPSLSSGAEVLETRANNERFIGMAVAGDEHEAQAAQLRALAAYSPVGE